MVASLAKICGGGSSSSIISYTATFCLFEPSGFSAKATPIVRHLSFQADIQLRIKEIIQSYALLAGTHTRIRDLFRGNLSIQDDSKLLSGFPWPIIFKPETTK
jgi:hypothetical protein